MGVSAGRLVAVQVAPLSVVYDGTESAGAQMALLRAVTAMFDASLVLAAPPGANVAKVAQVLPPSPDQKPVPAPPVFNTPTPAM